MFSWIQWRKSRHFAIISSNFAIFLYFIYKCSQWRSNTSYLLAQIAVSYHIFECRMRSSYDLIVFWSKTGRIFRKNLQKCLFLRFFPCSAPIKSKNLKIKVLIVENIVPIIKVIWKKYILLGHNDTINRLFRSKHHLIIKASSPNELMFILVNFLDGHRDNI